MSLLTIMAQEQWPEMGVLALWSCSLGGEKPGGLLGGSDVLAEI